MKPLTAQLSDRLIVLTATVAMAARQYHIPSADFWRDVAGGTGVLPIALIATIGVFGAFTPFQELARRGITEERTATRTEVLTHYGSILRIATRSPGALDIGDVALHIWRVRRSLRHPRHGCLVRVATYRLGVAQTTRSFSPTRGIGVVGLCWKHNAEQSRNVERMAAEFRSRAAFENFANTEGSDAVMGLSWAGFTRLRHRGAVFATPVRSGSGSFVGCLSVDASTGYGILQTDDFWHELNALAQTLGKAGLHNV